MSRSETATFDTKNRGQKAKIGLYNKEKNLGGKKSRHRQPAATNQEGPFSRLFK